jgi:hypothetical protein
LSDEFVFGGTIEQWALIIALSMIEATHAPAKR